MAKPVVRFRSRVLERGRTLTDGKRVRAGAVVQDCWLEAKVTDQWMVAYRLVPQMGRPVVAEIRVFPGVPNTYANPGEWSVEWEGNKVDVPAGGMLARVVQKDLRFGSYMSFVSEAIRKMELEWGRSALYDDGSLLSRHGFTPAVSEIESRVGRPPEHDSVFLARLARDLNRAVSDGHTKDPVKQLANTAKYPYAVTKMYRLVSRARNKGMLSSPVPGLSGGQATDRAKALLRAANEEEE